LDRADPRFRVPALFVVGLAVAVVSCAPRERALLVELSEVSPRSVEVGDRLRITGSGFPEGRPATVVLRGDASRAGEPVAEDVEITTEARLVAPHALEVQVTPELAAAICDRADPRHTTLRADLEVRFASFRGPRTSVTGRLEGVTLDVVPEERSETSLALLRKEGTRFANFLGADVTRSEEGVTVTAVAEKSRASRAGLLPGDVVLELDGLLVHGLADFVPPPNSRATRLSVRRGLETFTLTAESAGFRFTSPASLTHAVALVMAVVFVFGLFASPFGRLLGLLERRLVERLRDRETSGRKRSPLLGALRELSRQLPSSLGRHLALVSVTAVLMLIAFGQSVVDSEVDLVILPLVTLTGLLTVTLLAGGGEARPRLLSALGRALAVLLHQIPLIVALALSLLTTGSFRAQDIVRSQGAWPWQWHLVSTPWLALAAMLAFAGQVPFARPVGSSLSNPPVGWRTRALDVAQWTHELVVCGLFALTLLGGWAPGGSGALAADMAGAAILLCKTWTLLLGIALVRWTLGPLDAVRVLSSAVFWFSLPSLALLTLALILRRLPATAANAAFGHQGAWALLAAIVLALAWLMHRVARQARNQSVELRVLPWV
jgi:NADH-quinone oxidoreductase subunit H